MNTPPLLLAAALLFWGWQAGFLWMGILLAALLESSRRIQARWEFAQTDLDRVWIELAVFERELGHITAGDAVEISPQTNLAVVLKGKVAHVGDTIDRETRSGDVRVVVENVDGSLRPGQSVLAKIHTKTTPSAVLLLPRDAITSVDGKQTVFVEHDATSVEPRAVTTGARDGTRVEITAGLAPTDRVATSGVFALKSEIFR